MAADEDQKPIDRVFDELQAKGLVAAKTKLKREPVDWWHDFGGAKGVIHYNERYSYEEDNLLRFALLHEQKHLMIEKTWTPKAFYAAYVAIVVVTLLRVLDGLGLVLIPIALLPALWLLIAARRANETKADLHAAKTMIENFEIEKPSVIAISLFKTLRERPRNRTTVAYRVRHFSYAGLHPTDEERIKAIQELEESLAKGAGADGNTVQ